jgi:glycosyltransferase involved in cell wall biosynthesis
MYDRERIIRGNGPARAAEISANSVRKFGLPAIVAIIPAYNEERFIGSAVLSARKHTDTVIVVDDGSDDATAEVAAAAGALVVKHAENRGKGAAFSSGFARARELCPDVVVTLDADGQHLAEQIGRVAAPVLAGKADIVIGSRYLQPTGNVPRHRVWGHHLFNFMTNRASGVSVTDSQSGFRAFSARAVQHISFQSAGFSVESEMQFLAREHELKMVEVSITICYHDKAKRPVIAHGMMVLNGLLRLVGQYRPLLFFGLPGFLLLLVGLLWGLWVIDYYRQTRVLDMGYALISMLLFLVGNMILTTAIILHSVRGLLLSMLQTPRQSD